MASPHKKPMALRELEGTAHRNKHRNNYDAPVPTRGIGPAPDRFCDVEKKIWDEFVDIMYTGVLGEADRLSLEIAVSLFYRFRHGVHYFPNETRKDDVPTGLTAAELSRLCGLLSEFGMTPSSRQKIVIPKQTQKNVFESI
jgi:phage terminase small subunit